MLPRVSHPGEFSFRTETDMRRLFPYLVIVALAVIVTFVCARLPTDEPVDSVSVERAHAEKRSNLWLEATGRVPSELADDTDPPRHQRFILVLDSGHTVLVAHNIDVATRVPLEEGDRLTVRGEYEWNERGGIIHWTHRDESGRRAGGWVRLKGVHYR
jgi:hypothetical protein